MFSGVSATLNGTAPRGFPYFVRECPESGVGDAPEGTVNYRERGSELHAPNAVVVYHGPIVADKEETEAKWRADEREHERVRKALRRAGASHIRTVNEINTLFDSVDGALRMRGHVLRVRRLDDGDSILTLKGPATYREGIKTREETELHFTDRDAMLRILSSLGFSAVLEYQKTRESWDFDGVVVELDTLEFGRFVEIEGSEDRIRSTADLLCLDMSKAERQGYPSMMRAHQATERGN